MDSVAISIMTPAAWAGEIEAFAREHAGDVTVEQEAHGKGEARDLGFEPITTALVAAWLLKFGAGVASGLASKLVVDRIWKKMQSEKSDSPSEVQIAFPNGNVLTIRSADRMDPEQLRRLIEENLRS
jgi:hypothetical protein